MMDEDIFAKAKALVSVETVATAAGVKLVGGQTQKRSACPIQGCGVKSKTQPFAVYPGKGRFRCYGCGAWGDVVELELQLGGGSAIEAARRLVGVEYRPAPPRRVMTPADDAQNDRKRRDMAQGLWTAARSILGSLAEKYLLARHIHPAVIAQVAARLRFHPAASHSWDDQSRSWNKAPAVLAQVETETGPTGGVHATYLLRDGSGRDKALGKKMWGPQVDLDGRPGGAWLIGPVKDGFDGTPLVHGEGIETVCSLASLAWMQGRRVRAVAALSLDRLQGGLERDPDGCMDLEKPKADLARPPFLWASPETQPWPEILVAIDHDMRGWKTMARTGRGRIVPTILDAGDRAALCGTLVKQHWRGAGSPAVRTLLPPPNSDWNNELQRRVEAELARSGVSA